MLIFALSLACAPTPTPESAAPAVPAADPADASAKTDAPAAVEPAPPAPVGPPVTASVRLRFDPVAGDPPATHLTIEAFLDTKLLASGETDVPGVCLPAPRPPAGMEPGAAFLKCDGPGTSAFVKLVGLDGVATIVSRPVVSEPSAYQTVYQLPPPPGIVFDL